MSNMLGRTRPFDARSWCPCPKHGGPEKMGPKRRREERDWRREIEPDIEYSPLPCVRLFR